MTKDRRLGRGLAALLGTPLDELDAATTMGEESAAAAVAGAAAAPDSPRAAASLSPAGPASGDLPDADRLIQLEVVQVDENPFQPRRDFGESEIASLAESLKEHRMLQPILVRRVGPRYQVISGERRLRAAIQAGWTHVPAQVREADDRLVAELAIVENLQRKDLNPVEKALSFRRYLDNHHCSQEDLAQRLKIDRSTIANLMRLLELPDSVLAAVRSGTLSAGHARALLSLGDDALQVEFAQRIQDEGLSVRAVEAMVQEQLCEEDGPVLGIVGREGKATRRKQPRSEQVQALEQQLRRVLGTKVEIRETARGRGRIVISFGGHEEFERIFDLIAGDSGATARRTG